MASHDMTHPDDGSHVLGLAHGGQTGDAATDDENLGRRDLSGGGDLTGEEAAKVVGRLDDGPVARNVAHRRQSVKHLSSGDSRDTVHA